MSSNTSCTLIAEEAKMLPGSTKRKAIFRLGSIIIDLPICHAGYILVDKHSTTYTDLSGIIPIQAIHTARLGLNKFYYLPYQVLQSGLTNCPFLS